MNGLKLHVVDEGTGPPVLLIHGFPLDHSMWRHQVAALRGQYRVLAPDLRGLGASEGAGENASMETRADDLAGLLDSLNIRQPITVCGLSMGGYVAFQFWRRHPERLSRLILCDTRAAADGEEVVRGRLQMAERVLREGPAFVADVMLERILTESTRRERPEVVADLRRVILATDPKAIAAAQRGMAARPDVTASLGDISIPTLVVCGEHDVVSPAAEMRAIAELGHFTCASFEIPAQPAEKDARMIQSKHRANGFFMVAHLLSRSTTPSSLSLVTPSSLSCQR